LEYFKELEQATRMLNRPGESLIFEADFLYMVERVDICIDFLRGHVKIVLSLRGSLVLIPSQRHFKEAEVYLLRFQQCMTRSMTLIKMNFVGSLRALSSEVTKRLSEKVTRSSIFLKNIFVAS
jgi:conserved oligomeric Golgi complex subunit 3